MMSGSENSALGRRAWEAISDSDLDALRRLWSEKLVWHAEGGGHPWSGHFEGRDAVIEHLAQIGDSVEQFVSVWLSPLNPEALEKLWRDFPD